MRLGKQMALILLVAILAFSGMLMSCGSEGDATAASPGAAGGTGENLTIGFSMFTMRNPYYRTMFETMERVCAERGHELIALDAQDSVTKQVADIEDLITQQVDIIVMNPFEAESIVPVTHEAADAGIPMISVDNSVGHEAAVVTTVQSNNPLNGQLVGEWVAQQLGGEPVRAIMISGAKGTLVSLERRQGLIRGIIEEQLRTQGTADVEIVAQGYTEWTRDQALKVFEDIMATNPDFNTILSEADVMTLEALKVLKEQGFDREIVVGNAADGQKEAFELIMTEEWNYATGLNSPALIGRTAIDIAEGIMRGETYPRTSFTPAAAVTIENVDEFYDPNALF
jgi:ribose transport system substrate-binding protein